MTIAAVVTAAGLGTRLGSGLPKALVPVGGRPLVAWAVEAVIQVAVDIVVAAPPAARQDMERALQSAMAASPDARLSVVAGGDTRQRSVAAALAAVPTEASIILVHDAARAFQTPEAMRAAIGAVEAGADGAVPVVPLVDTLVAAPGPDGALGAGVDRDALRAAQTPQAFAASPLRDAHARAEAEGITDATDDASLLRRYGYRVVATEGHPWGFKVTTAADLAHAEHVATLGGVRS